MYLNYIVVIADVCAQYDAYSAYSMFVSILFNAQYIVKFVWVISLLYS